MTTRGRRPALGRKEVLPRPAPSELQELPVHVVVADYPETLRVLREKGLDTAETGGEPLGEVAGPDDSATLHGLIGWREKASRARGTEPCRESRS